MKKSILLLAVIAFLFSGKIDAQMNLNADIPVDRSVRIGKLDNGLTYYIKKNERPEKRIEMRLAVNVGSMQEDDHQQGLAHFNEHMAFNGTRDFPKNKLVSYLQSIGMRFGADLNAYTSFDETVYMLTVPSDKPEIVENGYKVLLNWAAYMTLDGKEIEAERGIIMEEWRMGLGADDRMRKKWFPVLFNNSRYANRLPIGLTEVIQHCKHDALRTFYADWYRPDLQAIIVVGDVDLDQTEAKIKENFAPIPKRENPREKVVYDIPGNIEPLVSVTTDKEATSNMVIYLTKHKATISKTIADYKDDLEAALFNLMLNSRFNEIQQKADCPFVMASTGYDGFFARTMEAYMSYAVAKESQIEKAFETLIRENQRVLQYGFLETEFDRAKEELLSSFEKRANEVDKNESASFAAEYVQHYLTEEPIPGAKNEFNFAKRLLDDIKLEEVNALAKKWITPENQVVIVTGPEKEGVKIPNEKEIRDILNNKELHKVAPYVDNFKPEPLITKELVAGKKSVKGAENTELGVTEYTLSNGIKVVLKPTEFKNDEILMYAHSRGGVSLTNAEDYPSVLLATTIVDRAGLGEFDNVELSKKLKGKNISITPFIDQVKEGFVGNSTVKDIETLLQLTYLYFEAPRRDETAFESVVSEMTNQLKLLGNNPMYAMIDTLMKTSTQNDPRQVAIPNEAFISRANFDKVWEIYNERFDNAGDFTFFFVGSFSNDEIIPMIELYLGNLPNTNKKENFKDVFNKFPKTKKDIEVRKGTEDKSMVGIIFSEEYEWKPETNLYLTMYEQALSIKLIEVIREKMSGVYSPQTQMSFSKYPTSSYTLMVLFGCSPKKTNKLTKAVLKIMNEINKKGIDEETLDKVKEQMLRKRETDISTNRFWLSKISESEFNGDPLSVNEFEAKVKAVTSKQIQTTAQKLIKTDHSVRAVLYPEKKSKK